VFQGQSLRVSALDADGVFEVCFDRVGEAINKFDDRTVGELSEAVQMLQRQPGLRGVLVTSAKDVFIVGADITEFGAKFSQAADAIARDVARSNDVFVAFEDLPVPTVVAINGFALGGGLEFVLANSLRVMSETAQVGVPEAHHLFFLGREGKSGEGGFGQVHAIRRREGKVGAVEDLRDRRQGAQGGDLLRHHRESSVVVEARERLECLRRRQCARAESGKRADAGDPHGEKRQRASGVRQDELDAGVAC